MHIRVPHYTTKAAARRKIESMLDQMAADYGNMVQDLEHGWDGEILGFSFKAKGLKVAGTVEVTAKEVLLHGKLPLLALAFEPKIRHMVVSQAEKVFPERKA